MNTYIYIFFSLVKELTIEDEEVSYGLQKFEYRPHVNQDQSSWRRFADQPRV